MASTIDGASELIDYTSLTDADRRDLNQDVLRGLERTYEARRMDAEKARRQIHALETGKHGLDQRFVVERLKQIRLNLENIRVDLFTMKGDIAWHRETIAGLPQAEEPGTD